MSAKMEHDFLNWVSPPSGIKFINKVFYLQGWWQMFVDLPVKPGSKLRVEINGKSDNVLTPWTESAAPNRGSYLSVHGSPAVTAYRFILSAPPEPGLYGKTGWSKYVSETIIPSGVVKIRASFVAAKGTTWFDNLQIYHDDVPIYSNYFTALRPGKVVPTIIQPPEIIVGMMQRFKASRTGEEVIRAPMAPIL